MKKSDRTKLSIIIPVFNEKNTIEQILQRVIDAPVFNFEKEIIVVNDGSTDGTSKILKELKNKFDFILLEHSKNQGKGIAVQTALKKVSGDFILIQDADLEYSPQDYPRLLKTVNKDNLIVYGSRNINPENQGYSHYVLGAKFLTFLLNKLFKTKLTDAYTCYKLIPASVIKNIKIKSSGFEFEAEITTKILKKGIPIKEVPIHYFPRKFKQGKKIRFKDGIIGIWTMIKYKFFT